MNKIPAINEIDANSPSQESTEVVVKATTVTPDINEIQETISTSATIQEIDGTRKPTISEIYKIVNDGLFESTTNWWDYAYKISQAQLNQDIISRLDNGVIGGGYSKGVDIITTTSNKVPSNTNVYSALKSDSLYPKKLNDEVINGIYDFLNGLTIGKPTAYTGGTWSVDQIGKTHLTTDYLYVRLKAIFETLQILNVDTIGGKLVISPAGSIRVAYVDRIKIDAPVFIHNEETDVWSISQVEDAECNLVNETLNQEVYRCYFLGEQDGEEIDNKWKVGDQAQAKTFNVKKGTYHKVENSYLWRLVVNVSSNTVDIDGKKYHYVDLSQIDFDSGSDAPAPGDILNQLGHRLNDTQRQTALVLNAVDNYAPSITLYAGVNYYTLLNKEYVEFGVFNGKAFFNVYGDMYIGDKGENPKTYIKYKNGKINIKANLEIGSSIGDKDLDQYIKENGGVDEDTVKNLINNAQVIKDLQNQADGAIETWFYEGEPTLDNLPAVDWTTNDIKKIHVGDLYYDQTTGYAYRFTKYNDDVNPYRWNRIKDNDIVAALDAADKAQATANSKMKVFYGETKPTNYQVGDMWVNATIEGKFNNDIARAVADNKTSFNADDWVLASRYSEAIATIQKWTNEYETKFGIIKDQLDGKAETWYQVDDPSTDWTDKASHEGDIWYNTTNGTTNYWNGSVWEQMDIPKDVFDTIDGKSSIFVDSYAEAKAGTGVICKGYKERDLWILPEDATVNGVKYYKGDMLTAVSNNTNFDETNWKKKVRYVGQTELTSAIDIVNEKINTINNTTIPGINNKFNEFIKDGVLDSSEKARLTDLLNQASNEVAAVVDQVNNITTSKYLTNDNANKGKLEEANTVMNTAWTEYKNLINTLVNGNTEITKVNIGEANTKYKNLQEKIKAVKQYLAICQADVLNGMGTDITSYKYLKDALNQTTEINGGLVLTSAIQLKDVDKKVTAGMNGIVKGDKTSIAAWYGGPMVDRDTFTSEELKTKIPGTDYAMSLLRHDGTGYLAGGNIHWNTDGVLSGNFNSFILQGTSMVTMFYYIRLFYLHTANQDTTDFNNIDYVTPMKTFSRLSVLPLGGIEGGNSLPTGLFIGDSNTGGSFQIGNVILRTKSGDPNILEIVSADSNKTAHLGVQGGVSAYGTYTSSTGGGGGLNGTVVSYANIIAGNYNDTDLTKIPNAYSVKALSNRIDNIATELSGLNLSWNNITGKPTTFIPSAHNHKWVDITDRITNVSQLTNDAGYLTTHQSLADYYTRAEIDAKGYTTNKGTVTSVGLTLPIGLTCATKTITTNGTFAISFTSGYSIPTTTKQSSWDSAVLVKHSHSNKTVLDEITSTKVKNWDSAYSWYSLITTDEETADGIINKWNEVVNFLANIAQTNTLSGIIDGINTSISNEVSRAKNAEGTNASNISANKTSITTLQGYFTSGSAKKALQLTTAHSLWGNAFNGTADINGSIVLPSDKYISIGNIKLEYDATNKALKITNTTTNEVANLYTSGGVTAYGVGSVASSGGGLNGTIIPYSTAITSDPQNEGSKIASASSIYKLHSRISAIENNGATSITVTGTGNAITSVSKNGTSITFTKGSTFLTSHQSLENYVTINDSRLSDSRYPKFANSTWYLVGDDAYIGDHDRGGMFCIKSANNDNVSGIAIYNKAESNAANIWFDNTNINLDKQLVMNNKRIWIQGVGTAGGNNNRLTLVAGMPSGLAYNTSCRGTILYSNGIAFADPYNGNSNNDSGWIRHLETNANSGTLEIGVGDDASNEEIHFRWYNTNSSAETIAHDITVPRATGTLALTSQIPTTLPANGGNADTVDGYHATDGRTFEGNINWGSWKDTWSDGTNNHPWYGFDHRYPNTGAYSTTISDYFGMTIKTYNTLRLDFGTLLLNGTSIYSINVASATKLQTPRTIWGQSFDGTGNVDGELVVNGQIYSSFASNNGNPCIMVNPTNDTDWCYGIEVLATKLTAGHRTGAYWAGKANSTNNAICMSYYHAGDGSEDNRLIWHTWGSGDKMMLTANGRVGIGATPSYKLHVAGDIYSSSTIRTTAQNQAIVLSNNSSPAWISALEGQIIFNIGNAIRFGETAWDYNQWAGLKYTHSNKTIYLGIADGSAFIANSAQSNGTLRLAGITTVTPDSGARIGNNNGDLYLGNANNSSWVKVQDMCSQSDSGNWVIYQNGDARFRTLTVNGNATISGSVKVNNMLTAKAIMFTTADSNEFGTNLQNWDGSIAANVTNMFNGIDRNNISIEYSANGGSSWSTYTINPNYLFNLINDNSDIQKFYLGNNIISGSSDADKLTQIKANQLRVTIKIPPEVYQELAWISVDVDNGVDIKCQVYFGNSNGVYTEYVSKVFTGWSHRCDICVGPLNVNVGTDTYRYVRLVFSHLSSHTALRNGIISRIRALALTKYNNPSRRYNISTTGHIYNYDYNMNTYFPNSIIAEGGVTAYQSSDVRLKTNITKLNCLNVIKSIGGTYEFDYIRDHKHSIGFIAQNVNNPLLNDIVAKDDNGYLKINYWNPKFISLAFGALTEIDYEVDKLKARVRELENEVEYLKNKDYVLQ